MLSLGWMHVGWMGVWLDSRISLTLPSHPPSAASKLSRRESSLDLCKDKEARFLRIDGHEPSPRRSLSQRVSSLFLRRGSDAKLEVNDTSTVGGSTCSSAQPSPLVDDKDDLDI